MSDSYYDPGYHSAGFSSRGGCRHGGGDSYYVVDDDDDLYSSNDDDDIPDFELPPDFHTWVSGGAGRRRAPQLRLVERHSRQGSETAYREPPWANHDYDRHGAPGRLGGRIHGAGGHRGRHGMDSLDEFPHDEFSSENEGPRRREHEAGEGRGRHRRDTVRGGGRRDHHHHRDPHVGHGGEGTGGGRVMLDFGGLSDEDGLGLSDEGMGGPSRRHGGGRGGREHGVGGGRRSRHGGGREGGHGAPRPGGGHGPPGNGGRRGISLADFSDDHESDY